MVRLEDKERFKLVPTVHTFLWKEDQILLLRRKNTGRGDGKYIVPAGHVDGNETIRCAAAREVLEESGVIVLPKDLQVCHVIHHRYLHDGAYLERLHFFLNATAWQGSPKNAEPEKCDDMRWFPISSLPTNMVPYTKAALENYRKNVLYSEFGWE